MKSRTYTALTDEELCAVIRGGGGASEAAFTELYNRYSSRIHAYCYRIVNDRAAAEDISRKPLCGCSKRRSPTAK